MSVHQKLGIILESKVVQKLSLGKKCFYQKMISQIDILKWLTATYFKRKQEIFREKKFVDSKFAETGYIVLLL